MYLLRGSLPWQGLQAKTKEERYKKILKKKIDITSYDLCIGFPSEFEKYIEYTRNLEYTEEPKYDILKELFSKVMKRESFKLDYIYDWTTKDELKLRNNNLTMKTEASSQHHSKFKRAWSIKAQYASDLDENNGKLNRKLTNDSNLNIRNDDNDTRGCCGGCFM